MIEAGAAAAPRLCWVLQRTPLWSTAGMGAPLSEAAVRPCAVKVGSARTPL